VPSKSVFPESSARILLRCSITSLGLAEKVGEITLMSGYFSFRRAAFYESPDDRNPCIYIIFITGFWGAIG
jgi:hypothetical protein